MLHQAFDGDVRVVYICADGVADLGEVVWSHICRHTHRNTGRSVKQKQRGLCGQDGRFLERLVEVRHKVDSILVEILEHFFSQLFKLGLGVTHSCDRVAVHAAEVTLSENKWISHIPRLREAGHGIIYAGITVGVILTENLTDDTG